MIFGDVDCFPALQFGFLSLGAVNAKLGEMQLLLSPQGRRRKSSVGSRVIPQTSPSDFHRRVLFMKGDIPREGMQMWHPREERLAFRCSRSVWLTFEARTCNGLDLHLFFSL